MKGLLVTWPKQSLEIKTWTFEDDAWTRWECHKLKGVEVLEWRVVKGLDGNEHM